MRRINKLKPVDYAWLGLIFIGNGVLAGAAVIYGFLNSYLYLLLSAIFTIVLINIVFSIRTKNLFYLVTALHYTIISLYFVAVIIENSQLLNLMRISFLFSLFFLLYLGLTRKLKWRKRELLEMAAENIKVAPGSFTNRPKPLEKKQYTRSELIGFSKFLFKKLIAVPYYEEKSVVFVVTNKYTNHVLNLRNNYSEETHVTFGFDGSISVSIAKKDYLKYKEELSFDQICYSLGELFIGFLELYKKNETVRIIYRMDRLKFNPFFGGIIGF